MTMIKVTSEDLQSVSRQLSVGAEDVAQRLGSMQSQVQALIDADWVGTASDAFRGLWDEWQSGAQQVQEALTGISQMLAAAARAYQETEDQLTSQIRA